MRQGGAGTQRPPESESLGKFIPMESEPQQWGGEDEQQEWGWGHRVWRMWGQSKRQEHERQRPLMVTVTLRGWGWAMPDARGHQAGP